MIKYKAIKKMLRSMSLRLWLLVALIIVFGLGVIIYSYSRRRTNEIKDELLFTVEQGPLTVSVTEAGTISPREQLIIKSAIEGRTTILYLIPEGTRVKKGELLVELDATDLQDEKIDQEIRLQNAESAYIQSRENLDVVKNQAKSDIDKAKLDLRFAKEDLVQYKEGEYPNTLKERNAKITLTKEELQRAEETLEWSKVLYKEKYLAESELQADQLAVKKAQLDIELAENQLALLENYTYKRKIAELKSDISQAEMAFERITSKATANIVQAEAELIAKKSEFNRQRDKLDKINEQIERARITAPREGLVVYATTAQFRWRGNTEPLDEGQEVRERQELIYLPVASTFMANVKIHESNLEKIKPGLPVKVNVNAVSDREFTGKIASIAPLADPVSMFMNPDLKLYDTVIYIDKGAEILRTGMSCEAEIIIAEYKSAVYVPVQSVVRINGQPVVFVKTGGKVVPRVVELGLDNNRMIHIIKGLHKGEQVLLAPPLNLTDDSGGIKAASVKNQTKDKLKQSKAIDAGADQKKDIPRRKTIRNEAASQTLEHKKEFSDKIKEDKTGGTLTPGKP
jgi:HlyD family secretion protein